MNDQQQVENEMTESQMRDEQEMSVLAACIDALVCIDDKRTLHRIMVYLNDRFMPVGDD